MVNVKPASLEIVTAAETEAARLYKIIETLGHAKDSDYFERCLALQAQGTRQLFIIRSDGDDCGYAILNWTPKYGMFKKLGIPEIQDLNVIPSARRQGLATALIAHCENLVRERGMTQMGIGVGLGRSYGPAQKLYIKLGYLPDGNGITYDRQTLNYGDLQPNDDNLCLMMVKNLT